MAFRCTGEMCMVHIGEASIDMGNYYVNEETGEKVLITRRELAEKYCQLVPVRIYVRRPTSVASGAAITPAGEGETRTVQHRVERTLLNESRQPSWWDDGLDDAVIGSLP